MSEKESVSPTSDPSKVSTIKRPPVVKIEEEDDNSSNSIKHHSSVLTSASVQSPCSPKSAPTSTLGSLLKRTGTFRNKIAPKSQTILRSTSPSSSIPSASSASSSTRSKKGSLKGSSFLKGFLFSSSRKQPSSSRPKSSPQSTTFVETKYRNKELSHSIDVDEDEQELENSNDFVTAESFSASLSPKRLFFIKNHTATTDLKNSCNVDDSSKERKSIGMGRLRFDAGRNIGSSSNCNQHDTNGCKKKDGEDDADTSIRKRTSTLNSLLSPHRLSRSITRAMNFNGLSPTTPSDYNSESVGGRKGSSVERHDGDKSDRSDKRLKSVFKQRSLSNLNTKVSPVNHHHQGRHKNDNEEGSGIRRMRSRSNRSKTAKPHSVKLSSKNSFSTSRLDDFVSMERDREREFSMSFNASSRQKIADAVWCYGPSIKDLRAGRRMVSSSHHHYLHQHHQRVYKASSSSSVLRSELYRDVDIASSSHKGTGHRSHHKHVTVEDERGKLRNTADYIVGSDYSQTPHHGILGDDGDDEPSEDTMQGLMDCLIDIENDSE